MKLEKALNLWNSAGFTDVEFQEVSSGKPLRSPEGQWTVVSQKPRAGTSLPQDRTIVAIVEKSGSAGSRDKKDKKDAETVLVPDGVGMNYQDAQDLWRGSGLVVLPAKDASGQGRWALWDSNWFVVAQSPAPGSQVKPGSPIRASILKYSD